MTNTSLQRFWLQEEVPSVASQCLSPKEQECESHFLTTHSRDNSGRYVVRLPFKLEPQRLGDSRLSATCLFHRVHQRIQRDSLFGQRYTAFMQKYADLGHMTAVLSEQGQVHPRVFLPHHGVLRKASSTTKLRVVFNGSSHTTSGVSLNECLHVGPKLQTDLNAVILRWRTHVIAFAADIEKMYRQILVHSDDCNFRRILWSTTDTPEEYQLCTVTYGLACAPYLALRVIQQLTTDEGNKFPLAADILRTEIYVDDIPSGTDMLHLARLKVTQLTNLLKVGGFRLQKWASNDETILSGLVNPSSISITRELQNETRTLGLVWQPATDSFKFDVSLSESPGLITKGSVLSRIAQLFDPLGWLALVAIIGKVFIQQLWKAQIGWDDPLPPSLSQQWATFDEELKSVTELSIPR